MKKAADASPNRALKREREQRCWSQLEVADRIGTTAFNVSRWERGITFPGAYFRQQLCAIFEKSPQELNFLDLEDEKERTEPEVEEIQIAAPPDEKNDDGTEKKPAYFPAAISSSTTRANEEIASIWHLPYRRNPFFIGRDETLQTLHAAFNPDGPALTQALAICGLGGIGKTQTAIEYAYRYRDEYQTIFWVRADTRELLIADFASLAGLLGLPEKNDQDQGHAVVAVKRWLSKQSRWLLVLDNVEDLETASDFIPETINGHLLLTTRAQSTGQIAQQVRLEKLSLENGIVLLLRRSKSLSNSAPLDDTSYTYWSKARAIAEIMDGLPLALDQAAAYIEETGCGLAGYVERYQQRRIALLRRRGGLRPQHPESIVATWSLSFEKIEQMYPAAAELLQLCAFLHPDAIAEKILTEGARELTEHLHLLATDPFELDNAIEALTTFSLLRRDSDQHILMLHRLVQIVLREQMNEETLRLWAERTVRVVDRAFPAVSFTTWPDCQQCLPHALVCVEFIEQLHMTFPAALSLLNKTGSYLRERAQYEEAERILTCALAFSEETLAEDAPMLAESLNNLGMLAHDQGRYARSETFLQRALSIYKQVWGPEHVTVALCLSNLAENYRVQAKLDQMEAYVGQALAIREKILGSEHPDVANSLNQLATLYHGQDKYSLAEPLYERALKIRQQTLGPEHIDVAESLNNLAYLYDAQGKYAQAESLYQQALALCEKNLGARHMYTAISLTNLAEVYRAQGKFEQAQQLHQQALEIREQTLGLDHPHTAKSLNLLAEYYLTQQDYRKSEELALQALAIWERVLGQEHYYVAIGLDTLARLRRAQGDLIEAEARAVRALTIFQNIWNNNNQHIVGCLNTLAEISYDQKAYARAEELLRQSLQIQAQVPVIEHLETARSLYNLALLWVAQVDYHQAEGYFTRALAIRRRVLLPQHPDLIIALQQYEELLHKMGNSTQLLMLKENIETANSTM